ncbi:hypothetical protein Pyrfu_0859 [Pyrolobus fumarii 1A]|uniref:Uncharacterized protein n=1 Tax=Pyrolobus fumarii (strain DSM 11204 / 1A) TaxID=694429 RepID=G0EDV9_PYRF1|nr:hypothetical protein [Pyrolobus fumarii]AEM38728.1 hypothetical protein Pyrfu_0859 [Pyrolobus fumarii 1A]
MPEENKKKMRMTLPKKESDLEKVVEEVMELHPEMAHEHEHEHHHHHHHHHHDIDELLHVVDTLIDIMNSRVHNLEERCSLIVEDVKLLYKLVGTLFAAIYARSEEEKRKALEEAIKILEAHRA